MSKSTKKEQVQRFITELTNNGEMFFSLGSTAKDYEYIKSVLNLQGFWAGTSNRYYFSDELYLVNITQRSK